jgi:ribose transport system substrate-binding protein
MKKVAVLILIVVFTVSMVLLMAGCKEEAAPVEEAVEEEAKQITVGFSMPFIEDSPYCFPFAEALRKEAANRGWELILTDAKGDINTQANQIEDMVAKGVDGIMIMPVDAAGIVSVIKKVYEETDGKLPMLASNVMPDPAELDELMGFAGPNSYLEGKLMGEYYVKYLEENGIDKINYCHLTGMAGYSAAIDRTNGFDDQLEEMGATDKFNLLDLQPGDWSPDKGQTLTENWITTYGDELQMIYAHNDGMGIGVVNALQNAGLEPGQIITNGCDGQTQAVEYIQQGWMLFTVFQSPATDGITSMDTMAKILAGEEIEYFTYMDTPIIDASNADEYIEICKELWK